VWSLQWLATLNKKQSQEPSGSDAPRWCPCIPNKKGKKGSRVPKKTQKRPANLRLSRPTTTTAAVMRGAGGMVRVTHREYVGSYTASSISGFVTIGRTDGYDLNPSNSALFPWLAPMALNFERFRFNALKFKIASANGTTLISGRHYITVDYDWDDPLPADKREFLGNQYTVSASLEQDLTLNLNPRLMHADMPWKYVKSPTRADPEPRTNYCGFILAAIDAIGSQCQLDFWVEYDVTLSTPQFDSVDPESLSRPEYSTSVVTAPTTDSTHITQVPLPASGVNFARMVTIPGAPSYLGVNLTNAVDIRKVNGGSAIIRTRISETGATPATVMSKVGLWTKAQVYDAVGTLLGTIKADTTTGSQGVEAAVAPAILSSLSTLGAETTWLVTMFPKLIKLSFASAAFVHLFTEGSASIGPSRVSCDLLSTMRPL